MSFPWKKLTSGWDKPDSFKETRNKLKKHTEDVINSEIYGETSDKRLGKRKKKNIEKPYKILVKYKDDYCSFWTRSKDWKIYNEFSKKNDRDHELAKMKRGYMNGWYDFKTADSDEEYERLLAS